MADQPQDLPEAPVVASESDVPYQSLYRRYRPQRFAEVRGQEHVVRALRNALRSGHVAHAYLFSGPRGTGKTSTARILAMALNCEHPVDGEPDGTCPSCQDIRRGTSLDVHELDAASNRKLDEMRDLLSRVALGTRGRWKVYIIDEVHQLTADAASALLKTLEEPPSHVVFILATTDPQKVLPTIVSRTQPFEFRLLGSEVLGGLLRDINEQAGLGVDPSGLDAVVRRGRGSARDALSVLDQVAAAGVVEDDSAVVIEVVEGLVERDAGRVLRAVAAATASGRDARRFGAEVIEHLRNGFLALQARDLVLLTDRALEVVEEQARRFGLAALVRALEVLGQALIDMRDSVDPRVTLEVAFIRLATPEADSSPAALAERLERLERAVAGGGALPPAAPALPRRADIPRAVAAPGEAALGARETVPGSGEAAQRPGPRQAALSSPEAPPASPGAAARSALGAHRRTPNPVPAAGRSAAGSPFVGTAGAPPAGGTSSDTHATPGDTRRRSATTAGSTGRPNPAPPRSSAPASPSTASPSTASPSTASPASAELPAAGLPSRDELTTAWGDRVLPDLPPAVKAYLAAGRFVRVDNQAAVFALPDRVLLERAAKVVKTAEEALGRCFGCSVPLRLVLDDAASPVVGPGRAPEADQVHDDPANYQLDDLVDADSAVVSPEQRLFQAFPGAEEVNP